MDNRPTTLSMMYGTVSYNLATEPAVGKTLTAPIRCSTAVPLELAGAVKGWFGYS